MCQKHKDYGHKVWWCSKCDTNEHEARLRDMVHATGGHKGSSDQQFERSLGKFTKRFN
jgi:hypothetical protein